MNILPWIKYNKQQRIINRLFTDSKHYHYTLQSYDQISVYDILHHLGDEARIVHVLQGRDLQSLDFTYKIIVTPGACRVSWSFGRSTHRNLRRGRFRGECFALIKKTIQSRPVAGLPPSSSTVRLSSKLRSKGARITPPGAKRTPSPHRPQRFNLQQRTPVYTPRGKFVPVSPRSAHP